MGSYSGRITGTMLGYQILDKFRLWWRVKILGKVQCYRNDKSCEDLIDGSLDEKSGKVPCPIHISLQANLAFHAQSKHATT